MDWEEAARHEGPTIMKHCLNLIGSGGLLIVSVIYSIWWVTGFTLIAIGWSLANLRRAFRHTRTS